MDDEEQDYVSAAERHNRIMDEADDAVRGLGCALILAGGFLLFVCLFALEYLIGRIP
jgi:hypothetical protein